LLALMPQIVPIVGTGRKHSILSSSFCFAWLPFVDAYRTFLRNPGVDGRRVLEQLARLPISA
jgi:hypothetical protein